MRTLSTLCLASLPYGAGFIEVSALRDPKESDGGRPVLYLATHTAEHLRDAGLPIGRELVSAGRFAAPLVRVAGIAWDIDKEQRASVPVTVSEWGAR